MTISDFAPTITDKMSLDVAINGKRVKTKATFEEMSKKGGVEAYLKALMAENQASQIIVTPYTKNGNAWITKGGSRAFFASIGEEMVQKALGNAVPITTGIASEPEAQKQAAPLSSAQPAPVSQPVFAGGSSLEIKAALMEQELQQLRPMRRECEDLRKENRRYEDEVYTLKREVRTLEEDKEKAKNAVPIEERVGNFLASEAGQGILGMAFQPRQGAPALAGPQLAGSKAEIVNWLQQAKDEEADYLYTILHLLTTNSDFANLLGGLVEDSQPKTQKHEPQTV